MAFKADWEGVGGLTDGMTYEFESGITFVSTDSNCTPLTIQGFSGQAAPLLKFLNYFGDTLALFDKDGSLDIGNGAYRNYGSLVVEKLKGARVFLFGYPSYSMIEGIPIGSEFKLQVFTSGASLALRGKDTDGGVGVILDNLINFTSGKLVSIRNNGTEKAYFEYDGSLWLGNAKYKGKTSSTGAPTTTEYPNDGDWGFHKDTTLGTLYLAFNDGGTIKTATLT